jgi:hypothetical protein
MYAVGVAGQIGAMWLRGRSVVGDVFTLHLLRRLYESFFVQLPRATLLGGWTVRDARDGAELPVGVYLGGLAHYALGAWTMSLFAGCAWQSLGVWGYGALFVIVVASFVQFWAHAVLGSLRASSPTSHSYSIPSNGPFATLGMAYPHYFAEIFIYAGLLVLAATCGSPRWPLAALAGFGAWTASNLTTTASRGWQWYLSTFGRPELAKRGIFRGLWWM